jgi:hypothetical protein
MSDVDETSRRRPLTEIARLDRAGRIGGAAHVAKYLRLIKRGAALTDGSRLYLAAVRDTGGWLVSLADLAEFRARLTSDRLGRDPGPDGHTTGAAATSTPPSPRSPVVAGRTARHREAAADRAGAALAAAGW